MVILAPWVAKAAPASKPTAYPGYPGSGSCQYDYGGSGSGGLVRIDPQEFDNNGTIDVSDGNGANTYGGDVIVDSTLFQNNGQILGVNPALAVPEPSTWAMLLAGFAALGFAGYRRRPPQRPLRPSA